MDENLSTLLFDTLNELLPLDASRAGMWTITNKYSSPPFFRFKLKCSSYSLGKYLELQRIIRKFEGNHRWELFNNYPKNEKYIIIPEVFLYYLLKEDFHFNQKNFEIELGYERYKKLVDDAIADVKGLSEYLKLNFTLLSNKT